MKYFTSLKLKDILSLAGLVIIGFAWILTDQIFFSQSGSRFVAFVLVMMILFYTQYLINKPDRIWHYANSLALTLIIFVVFSSIVIHAIILHDFADKIKHSASIWIITGLMPYLVGFIYLKTGKKEPRTTY